VATADVQGKSFSMLYLSLTDAPSLLPFPTRLPPPPTTTAHASTCSISLVLPCYNEERNIEHTVRDAQDWFAQEQIDGEIIVTDDGSTDGSLAVLCRLQQEMPNLKVVHHDVNRGYGAAVRSGCDQAQKPWIAFMDSDGQFHARDLSRLLPLASTADYVTGIREKRADTLHRRLNSWLYNMLVRVMLNVPVSDVNCGMKLFRRSIWSSIRPSYATGALVNAEMFCALEASKIPWKATVVPHYPRLAGNPTGAKPRVILQMFKELWQLKRARRNASVKQEPASAVPLAG
jgi:glycosyltransferase involved in cell wall biosynthesis